MNTGSDVVHLVRLSQLRVNTIIVIVDSNFLQDFVLLSNFSCLLGTLDKKTRILVTHQLQFLSKCDWVVILNKVSECYIMLHQSK